ncbi:putative ascorbate-specific transmembrane electron transporter 1 [Nicotiana tabacum]|uniref:ascorbate ferrireductase (transmembrane) n=1 Tax=Nicotiana tabacum TaxID=4097 RepID=A0A1S4BAU8_TOBAC|nr:PREDICTED: probable ascorbate-specific transmembrane electron transporter 1 [Nicotiana tabacum]
MADKGSNRSRGSYRTAGVPVPSLLTLFAHLLFIAITTLLLVWLLHFRDGLSFTSTNNLKLFNLHPFFMIIGFVLISGEAIMAFTTIPATRRTRKYFHMFLHLIGLGSSIVGLFAIFKFQHDTGKSNLLTLHSWIGISTVSLYALLYIVSFLVFFFPGAQNWRRARLVPWHVLYGIAVFFMGIVSAETGLIQKFIALGLQKGQEALIVNFTGLLLLLFGISVGLVVLLPVSYY